MSLLEEAWNSIQYQIKKAVSDPDANAYAQEQADAKKKADDAKAAADATKQEQADKAAAEKAAADKAEADAKAAKERATFSFTRMLGTVGGTFFTIFLVFLLFFGAVLGASLATNLNLYLSTPYRILYAIYGSLFFFVIIPYVLGYRWFWKGKRPRFYSLIPLIPYHLDSRVAAFLFSWLSYKPDDQIDSLKEWVKEQEES
jgi:cation transport ATPase